MKLSRRNLLQQAALGAGGASLGTLSATPVQGRVKEQDSSASNSELSEDLTHYVSDFIVKTNYANIPDAVIEVGKKSILDGLGLAL